MSPYLSHCVGTTGKFKMYVFWFGIKMLCENKYEDNKTKKKREVNRATKTLIRKN